MKKRRNLYIILAIVGVIVVILGALFIRDWVLPTFATPAAQGLPTTSGDAQDPVAALKARYTQTAAAKQAATPVATAAATSAFVVPQDKFVSFKYPKPASDNLLLDELYTSCVTERGATPTPTPAKPVATAAATPAPTLSATKAAANTDNLTFYAIDAAASEACYEVGEIFLEGDEFNLAIGVTKTMDGAVAIDRNNPSNSQISDFTINVSKFESDEPRRDGIIREKWLESNKYPFAKLTNVQTAGLPTTAYKDGDVLQFQILGDLEIHGTKRKAIFNATAVLKDDTLVVKATTDVKMTDFGFDAPSVAGLLNANKDLHFVLNLVAHKA